MKAWQDEFYRLVNLLFGNPPTEMELLACLVASALVAALILKVIVRSLKAGMPTAPRVLLALALSATFTFAGVGAVNLYVLPAVAGVPHAEWLPLVTAGVILIVVAVPLCAALMRMSFLDALLALALALAAGAAASLMAHYVAQALMTGDAEILKNRTRSDNLNEVLSR